MMMMAAQTPRASRITVRVQDKVATYLNNKKRREIMHLEESCKVTVQILGSEALYPEHIEIDCRDNDGNELTLRFLDESIVAKT